MEYEIELATWKWISTKDIKDRSVTIHFNVPNTLYDIIRRYDNKVLQLQIQEWEVNFELNCSLSTTGSPISWHKDHWGLIKLDVILDDVMLIWYLLKWKIFLKL